MVIWLLLQAFIITLWFLWIVNVLWSHDILHAFWALIQPSFLDGVYLQCCCSDCFTPYIVFATCLLLSQILHIFHYLSLSWIQRVLNFLCDSISMSFTLYAFMIVLDLLRSWYKHTPFHHICLGLWSSISFKGIHPLITIIFFLRPCQGIMMIVLYLSLSQTSIL